MRTEEWWEEKVHSYLLGKLTEEEAARAEAEFFDDDASYEQFQAAQDELFDAYARGALSPADREQFERQVLASPFLRERAEFAETLRDTMRNPAFRRQDVASAPLLSESEPATSWLQKLKAMMLEMTSGFRPLAATALLLLVAGSGWLLWETLRLRREVAQSQARLQEEARQSAQERQRAAQLAEQLRQEQLRRAQLENDLAAQSLPSEAPRSAAATILSFVLTPSGFRDGGRQPRLTVPPQVATIRLQLRFAGASANRDYHVEIETMDERKIWERAGLRAVSAQGGHQVTAMIPASALLDGDYIVKLNRRAANSGEEELASYPLRVVRN